MEIIDLLFNKIDLFLVVLARVSGVFQIAPIFAGERTPIYIRTGLAAIFSILIAMVLPVSLDPIPQQLLPFIQGWPVSLFWVCVGFIIYLVCGRAGSLTIYRYANGFAR